MTEEQKRNLRERLNEFFQNASKNKDEKGIITKVSLSESMSLSAEQIIKIDTDYKNGIREIPDDTLIDLRSYIDDIISMYDTELRRMEQYLKEKENYEQFKNKTDYLNINGVIRRVIWYKKNINDQNLANAELFVELPEEISGITKRKHEFIHKDDLDYYNALVEEMKKFINIRTACTRYSKHEINTGMLLNDLRRYSLSSRAMQMMKIRIEEEKSAPYSKTNLEELERELETIKGNIEKTDMEGLKAYMGKLARNIEELLKTTQKPGLENEKAMLVSIKYIIEKINRMLNERKNGKVSNFEIFKEIANLKSKIVEVIAKTEIQAIKDKLNTINNDEYLANRAELGENLSKLEEEIASKRQMDIHETKKPVVTPVNNEPQKEDDKKKQVSYSETNLEELEKELETIKGNIEKTDMEGLKAYMGKLARNIEELLKITQKPGLENEKAMLVSIKYIIEKINRMLNERKNGKVSNFEIFKEIANLKSKIVEVIAKTEIQAIKDKLNTINNDEYLANRAELGENLSKLEEEITSKRQMNIHETKEPVVTPVMPQTLEDGVDEVVERTSPSEEKQQVKNTTQPKNKKSLKLKIAAVATAIALAASAFSATLGALMNKKKNEEKQPVKSTASSISQVVENMKERYSERLEAIFNTVKNTISNNNLGGEDNQEEIQEQVAGLGDVVTIGEEIYKDIYSAASKENAQKPYYDVNKEYTIAKITMTNGSDTRTIYANKEGKEVYDALLQQGYTAMAYGITIMSPEEIESMSPEQIDANITGYENQEGIKLGDTIQKGRGI